MLPNFVRQHAGVLLYFNRYEITHTVFCYYTIIWKQRTLFSIYILFPPTSPASQRYIITTCARWDCYTTINYQIPCCTTQFSHRML